MQEGGGPPWANADATQKRLLNQDLIEAVDYAVNLQRDLRVERNTLLVILRSLARNNLQYATQLVAAAEDRGGAHGKITHLTVAFGTQVLMEVHDLLLQPTRADQVKMVLKLLEAQFERPVDTDAIRQMCCTDGPTPSHLTDQGMALCHVLRLALSEVRAAGYTAYAEERAASATPGANPWQLDWIGIRRGRALSSSSSADPPASDASSHGSTPSKRQSREGEAGQGSEGASGGECVAGSSDP